MTSRRKDHSSKPRKDNRKTGGTQPSGTGRKDVTGRTNVYPMSGPEMPPSGDAKVQPMGTFGQADRGPEGYQDSGSSEIIPPGGEKD